MGDDSGDPGTEGHTGSYGSTAAVPQCALEYPSIDALSKMHAAPKFSFGSKPKRMDDKDVSVPGPGSYFESYAETHRGRKAAPKFSFGAATRKELEKGRVPGPGAYACSSARGGTSFSCTPRRGETNCKPGKQHSTPGPGSHCIPDMIGLHGPRHAITPRRKSDTAAEERQRPGPGPGQYQPTEKVMSQAIPPKYGFGSAPARPGIPKSEIAPGPGAYRHNTELNGKGAKYSMRAKTAIDKVGMLKGLYIE